VCSGVGVRAAEHGDDDRPVEADAPAHDHAGFRQLLEREEDLTVVGEAADGVEAIELGRRLVPHVVVMDLRMPRIDGLEATRRLVAAPPSPRVLVLTTFDLDEYVFAALRAGASGFLLKDAAPDELVAAVRLVAAGEAMLAPPVTRRVLEEFVRSQLFLTEGTVKTHVAHILAELGVRDRAQAAILAYETGAVRVGDAGR
jgi:DNA-binding NarL/FixJ family response regulator